MGILILIRKNIQAEKRYFLRTLVEILIIIIFHIYIIVNSIQSVNTTDNNEKVQISQAAKLDDFSLLMSKGSVDPATLQLLYTPDNAFTKDIVVGVSEVLKLANPTGFETEYELKSTFDQSKHLAGIVFDKDITAKSKNVLKVAIRFPHAFRTVNPNEIRNMFWMTRCSGIISKSEDSNKADADIDLYIREGFLQLQHQIFVKWMGTLSANEETVPPITARGVANEFHGYCNRAYHAPISSLLYYFCFLYPFLNLVQRLGRERERNILAYHRNYGIKYWKHWVAHFLVSFFHFMVLCGILLIIIKVSWTSSGPNSNANELKIILFLALYSSALIVTAMTIVCMLVNTTNCLLFGFFVWITCYSLFIILIEYYRKTQLGWVIVSYLAFFNNALDRGTSILRDVSSKDFLEDYISLVCGLVGNILLHLTLMWHFQHFRPGRYVQRKPYDFLKLRSLCSRMQRRRDNIMRTLTITERRPSWHNFENPPVESDTVVKLVNVCTFHDPQKKLNHLQKVSLRAFRGEITALVGHNGSGKTTILCIIAGFRQPEAGKVTINDYSVYEEWTRGYIDVCFEQNPLFHFLTVSETLEYFISTKLGKKDEEKVKIEKRKWLQHLALSVPDENVRVYKLSFDQARLLYLCCVLCCDTEVILLDEPTMYMSFKERFAFWEIVRQERPKRAIIVATNSNDEAEMVADRIAILNNGVMNAYGTGFFLRTKFGVGYDLIILTEPFVNVDLITSMVSKFFPHITPDNQIGDQLFYKLPAKGTPLFQRMLIQLEKESHELGIRSIEVIGSELSEVGMTFGMRKYKQVLPEDGGVLRKMVLLQKRQLSCQQIQAMFLKNIIHQAPNIIPIIMMFVTLFLIFCIGSMSTVISAPPVIQTPITLGMPTTETTANLVKDYNDADACKFVEILGLQPGRQFQHSYTQSRLFNDKSFACNKESNYEDYFKASNNIESRLGAVEKAADSSFTIWYNNKILHTAAISLNLFHNLLISKRTDAEYAVSISNNPIPLPPRSKISVADEELSHMVFPLILGIVMPLTISCFIFRVVEERGKHLVMLYKVSGLSLGAYWFITLIWDMLTFFVYAIIFVIILTVSTIEGYAVGSKMVIFLLLLFYAFAAIPMTYLISMFFYESKLRSFMIAAAIHTITGLTFSILYWEVFHASSIFYYMVFIFPNFSLLDGVTHVYVQVRLNEYCSAQCKIVANCKEEEICQALPQCCFETFFKLEDPGILSQIITLIGGGILFILAIFAVELYRRAHLFPTSKRLNQLHTATYPYDDQDVMALKKRIGNCDLKQCKKAFYMVDQVENTLSKKTNLLKTISFDLKKGSCLALYGPRNSGKTHFIKQLIGEHGFVFGDIYIKGLEFKYDIRESYKFMGYCPQNGGLYNMLTGRELLTVMALVRGVPEADINGVIRELSAALDMRSVMNKKAKTYNLANRRKLNVAVALLLFKDVIILDEPTTGVNALARRVIWNVLRYARFSGKCIVFTTLDSAECEALADEVILFDHGEMFAIGSVQHLRQKFTHGFFLEVKLNRDGDTAEEAEENLQKDVENLKRFVTFLNENSEMRSQIGSIITFYCPVKNIIYSYLYGSLEKNRRRLNISSYTVSHGSMDNVLHNIIQTRLDQEQYSVREISSDTS